MTAQHPTQPEVLAHRDLLHELDTLHRSLTEAALRETAEAHFTGWHNLDERLVEVRRLAERAGLSEALAARLEQLDQVCASLRRMGMRADGAAPHVGRLAHDAAVLVPWPHEADLSAAEREHAEAAALLQRSRADMTAAADRGDVDAVLAMTRTVNVDLPERLAEADCQAQALRLQRVEHGYRLLKARAQLGQQDVLAAEAGVADARQLLDQRERELAIAERMNTVDITRARADVDEAEASVEQANQQQTQQRRQRLLAIASGSAGVAGVA